MSTQVCAEGVSEYVVLCTNEPCVGGDLPSPWISEHQSAHEALKAAKAHRSEDRAERLRVAGCCPTCKRAMT